MPWPVSQASAETGRAIGEHSLTPHLPVGEFFAIPLGHLRQSVSICGADSIELALCGQAPSAWISGSRSGSSPAKTCQRFGLGRMGKLNGR